VISSKNILEKIKIIRFLGEVFEFPQGIFLGKSLNFLTNFTSEIPRERILGERTSSPRESPGICNVFHNPLKVFRFIALFGR
jgi:hypothetical protein